METIKAVVYHAPGDIRVGRVPMPVCGADELLVKVDACAVCGTDLKSMVSGNPRIKAPKTMGYEFAGLIESVGPAVEGVAAGERVVMATSVSCGDAITATADTAISATTLPRWDSATRAAWRNTSPFPAGPFAMAT